ncbi:MAG: hypothetical protein RR255_00105 [Bacilli bacterium]
MKIYLIVEFNAYGERISYAYYERIKAEKEIERLEIISKNKELEKAICEKCIYGGGDNKPCEKFKVSENKDFCKNKSPIWLIKFHYRIDEIDLKK